MSRTVTIKRNLDAADDGVVQAVRTSDTSIQQQARLFLLDAGQEGTELLNKLGPTDAKNFLNARGQLPQTLRYSYSRLGATYGEDFWTYVTNAGVDSRTAAVRVANNVPESARARFLTDPTSDALVKLSRNSPETARKAARLYDGNSPRLIGFDKPSAQTVRNIATKTDVDDLAFAVKAGDATLTVQRSTIVNLAKGALEEATDLAIEEFLKAALKQDNIQPGQEYTVDPADLEPELEFDGDQIVIQVDDGGTVSSVSVVDND